MYWFAIWPIITIILGILVFLLSKENNKNTKYAETFLIGFFGGGGLTFLFAILTTIITDGRNVDWDSRIEQLTPEIKDFRLNAHSATELVKHDVNGSIKVKEFIDDDTFKHTRVYIHRPVHVVKTDDECPKIQQRVYRYNNGWALWDSTKTITYLYIPKNEEQ